MAARLWLALYSWLWRLAAPWLWLRIRRRARVEPVYGVAPGERFGWYGAPDGAAPVWVHAVSLGETRAAEPLVRALLARGLPVLLTHMTATGRAEGERLFAAERAAGQLRQAWLPYDLPGAARRFYRHMRPRCGLLMETEVWPNLVREGRRQGVPLALVSARLSPSSMRATLRLASLARATYGSLDAVLAQTPGDAERLAAVGARAPSVVGNLKFDMALPEALLEAGRQWHAALARPVVVLASTREGEEDAFLAALVQAGTAGKPSAAAGIPNAAPLPAAPLAVLVPRHPQRFDEVAALVESAGLRMVRRSALGPLPAASALPPDLDVVLGDSLGEMPMYYAAADVAVVGGSFEPLGGQNLIEACACGAPVIVGPHTFNFAQASADAIAAGAACRVADARHAWDTAVELLRDDAARQAMAAAALRFSQAHRGALARVLAALGPWLDPDTGRR